MTPGTALRKALWARVACFRRLWPLPVCVDSQCVQVAGSVPEVVFRNPRETRFESGGLSAAFRLPALHPWAGPIWCVCYNRLRLHIPTQVKERKLDHYNTRSSRNHRAQW